MSDKFFFKGRQDARQNTLRFGFKESANRKAGSKKYPLALVVLSEPRQHEVQALVDEAGLFANISIDKREGAAESIFELEVLLNKQSAIKVAKVPLRNEPCVCGSGIKYKKCCG